MVQVPLIDAPLIVPVQVPGTPDGVSPMYVKLFPLTEPPVPSNVSRQSMLRIVQPDWVKVQKSAPHVPVTPQVPARLTHADPARVREVARPAVSASELPPPAEHSERNAEVLGVEGAEYGYADAAQAPGAIIVR